MLLALDVEQGTVLAEASEHLGTILTATCQTVWVFMNGDIQPKQATVMEDGLVDFWALTRAAVEVLLLVKGK